MNCYKGKILWVDLEKATAQTRPLPAGWIRDYLGGEGFAAKILYDNLEPGTDPFAAENLLVFAPGALTGTTAPSASRMSVGFKSPLTGALGMSNIGGYLGAMIKRTGFDAVVFSGRAARPLYLYIDDTGVTFKDASKLWGLETLAVEEKIKAEIGNDEAVLATIGPAGEKLVRFANIISGGGRAAGRGGPGAVMGSKNLKAVAFYGGEKPGLAEPEKMKELNRAARQQLKEDYFVDKILSTYSTIAVMEPNSKLGLLATRNWQLSSFAESEKIGTEAFYDKLIVENETCFSCPVACKRVTEIPEGRYAGEKSGGPEYEALASFGPKCFVSELDAVVMSNHLCNRLGIDVISTGQVIATAMEWFEKGIITREDLGGIDLEFGSGAAMVEMVRLIGNRLGFGDLLAEGSYRAAGKIGGEAMKYVMHVKKMEMPVYDVRGSEGRALSYLTSDRGACHLRPTAPGSSAMSEPELGIRDVSAVKSENNSWVKALKEYFTAANCLGICIFSVATIAIKPSLLTGLFNAAAGENFTVADLLKSSERVINLERLFNGREGLNSSDDTLPERMLKEPRREGEVAGTVVRRDAIMAEFYELMQWDPKTGMPTEAKKKELGLN